MTIEYPICSGEFINICKVTFAEWVVDDISLDGYFVTFWWWVRANLFAIFTKNICVIISGQFFAFMFRLFKKTKSIFTLHYFFKHLDLLKIYRIQSEWLKKLHSVNFMLKFVYDIGSTSILCFNPAVSREQVSSARFRTLESR